MSTGTRNTLLSRLWPLLYGVALAMAMGLSGCATPSGAGADMSAATPSPIVTGRLSVRVDPEGRDNAQSFSSSFELEGTPERGTLRLLSPLGTVMAQVRWMPGSVRLDDAEGVREFATLDEVSQRLMGMTLPVSAFPSWLRGQPWPGVPFESDATPGFRQLGWLISLDRWHEGWLTAQQLDPPGARVRVRLDPR